MADAEISILVIEDNEADFQLLERALQKQLPSFRCRRVSTSQELRDALAGGRWDVVLSDYSVPGMNFKENLGFIQEHAPGLPVVLVSGSVGEETAVSLVHSGIWDFVLKDNLRRLGTVIERGLAEAAEHKARSEAEVALRTLLNAIPEAAILIDSEGIILATNETMARRYETIVKKLVGTSVWDLFLPEVADIRKKRIEESIRTGEPLHFEDSSFGRNLDNYVYPIMDASEQAKRVAILSIDITERKKAEERVKEQATFLDVASDAILFKDPDSRIVHWNKGAERLYGWSSEEAMGKKISELLYVEKYSSEPENAQTQALEKGEWHGDLHQKTKDNRDVIVEGRWTAMRDERGQLKGILSVNTDVTAKRSIEAQFLRSQRLESLGTLAGGIAHDLNNVLSPILMGVEALSFRNPDVSTRSVLEIIKTSAQRGANIVRQILNFARGLEGDVGEVQLKHVLHEIEEVIRETFPKSIALKADIPRDLWPVKADATQLHQVLMNLCVNARDAMPDGGQITLSAENVHLDEAYAQMNMEARPIRYVVMKVDDTGIGMPPGIMEKIFDPFFTTKEPGKGTGLGLSTVRSIAKAHGGFINVYSEQGKGASFKVYIPAVEQGTDIKDEGPKEIIPMGNGELILVVDDEVSLREIAHQILESYGYRVTEAADGTEALAQFVEKRSEIRAVITDMTMPYMDGAATIRALRKIDPRIPIIATSGLMVAEYSKEARGIGVQAFLAKPFTAEKLLQTLRQTLNDT